jgi:hypothetical protein
MTAMQSISTQSASSSLSGGFVMAMRATLTISSGQPRHEWIIVSRWGNSGEHLAVGWTESPAMPGKTAPLHLVPRRTALAELICLPPCSGPLTFLFVPRLPSASPANSPRWKALSGFRGAARGCDCVPRDGAANDQGGRHGVSRRLAPGGLANSLKVLRPKREIRAGPDRRGGALGNILLATSVRLS